jgi:hypothetical protein
LKTESYKHHVQSQLASNRTRYFRDMGDHRDGADIMRDAMEEFDEQWCHMEGRLKIVPGKDLISALAKRFQEQWNVSISPSSLAGEIRNSEMGDDLRTILEALDMFANTDE